MTDPTNRKFIWPTLDYAHAPAAIAFLTEAFGFTAQLVVTDPDDESVVEHAQLRWPEGGGVMLGTANRPGNPFSERPTGCAGTYVVTDHPDELHDRALANGATLFAELRDEEYGSRGFSVTDPEGNIWTFGTYTGE